VLSRFRSTVNGTGATLEIAGSADRTKVGDVSPSWSSRKVLVTGAGGFIGSHVVEALVVRGAEVRGFVRYNSRNDHGHLDRLSPAVTREVEVFVGDLANPEAVHGAVAGCEFVLHLGALIPIPYSYRHPREFVTANVEATLNMLEACRSTDVQRLVQVSTSEVYGTAQVVPISEEHPLHPQSPYAATKVGSDQLALSFQRSFGTPVVIARPFNTFGPRQSARAVIPTIITQALTRDHIELGATESTRDFLYVGDTAEGLIACAAAVGVEGETINLGTGQEWSIRDVVNEVGVLLDRELEIRTSAERVRPADSEVERLVADIGKASRLLEWVPRVEFRDGLRRTLTAVSEAIDSYKPELYNV
jgi:NAD dependent epimerase/dehydratase